jgi:hypothetical protein
MEHTLHPPGKRSAVHMHIPKPHENTDSITLTANHPPISRRNHIPLPPTHLPLRVSEKKQRKNRETQKNQKQNQKQETTIQQIENTKNRNDEN